LSSDFDKDDLARLLALEYAFECLALISASNFAYLAETSTSDAVREFRGATEGAMLDSRTYPADTRKLIQKHLRRLFDDVEKMAKEADQRPGST
jgi:hypothetical protein